MDQLKDALRVFVVPTEILDEELDIYEKMTYIVLRSYANGQDDTAFPSYKTIAKKGSMSRQKAIDCVKKLIELGFVAKEKRKKVSNNNGISDTSNLYTIYRPAEVKKKEVVHDVDCPGPQDRLPLVYDVDYSSPQDRPENNYLKELDLKELNKELLTIVNLQETPNSSEKDNSIKKETLDTMIESNTIITDQEQFREKFTDTCNTLYPDFAPRRWSKKQWNTLINKFVVETIENERYKNIPVGNMKNYAFVSIEKMATKRDIKNGTYNPLENISKDKPKYDWLNR